MGRKSIANYGTIFVFLEKLNYAPGQQINGTISINLQANFPSSSIIMLLEGKEKVLFWTERTETRTYGHGENQRTETITHHDPHYGTNRCYNHSFPVASFDTPYVPAGQYQIPFTFKLGEQAPSSFDYSWYQDRNSYAKISYHVKCLMESRGNCKDLLKSKTCFYVNAGIDRPIKQRQGELKDEVTVCCCFNKGEVYVKAYFEKDAYMPGETAIMIAEVANKSSIGVFAIEGNLINTLNLRANDGHTRNLSLTLSQVKSHGLKAGESKTGQNAQR